MSSWLQRATRNLIHHSLAKAFITAKREWRMTGRYNDLECDRADCELCEHPEIRHQFQIHNDATGHSLWIGSECIKKFVPVYVDGVEVRGERERAAAIDRITGSLIDEARKARAFRLLGQLAKTDNRFEDYLWKRDWGLGYSVRQLQMIAVAAKHKGFRFDAADFRINTRRGRVRDQVAELQPWQYQQLRAAFPQARRREFDATFK